MQVLAFYDILSITYLCCYGWYSAGKAGYPGRMCGIKIIVKYPILSNLKSEEGKIEVVGVQ